MQMPGNTILDVSGSIDQIAAVSSAEIPADSGFSEMLAGFVGSNPGLALPVNPDPGAVTMNRALAGDFEFTLADILADGSAEENLTAEMSGRRIDQSLQTLIEKLSTSIPRIGETTKPDYQTPLTGDASQSFTNNRWNTAPVDIGPGTYLIASDRVENGVATLELVDSTDASSRVTVSIPVDQFKAAMNQQGSNPSHLSRVGLNGTNPEQMRLENFISSLNLKEIEVLSTSRPQSTLPGAAVESASLTATITAERGGEEIAIRAKLNRDEDKPTIRGEGRERISLGNRSEQIEAVRPMTAGDLQRRVNVQARMITIGDKVNSSPELEGAFPEISESRLAFGPEKGSEPMFVSDISSASRQTAQNRVVTQSGRAYLPSDIPSKLSSKGGTIMLRIDPEHLGPARLNLIMRNDTLTAQVIVENSGARAVVENSLDDLLRQLARAEINVDRIDVNVGGQGSGAGQFDRSSPWAHRATSKVHANDDEEITGISQVETNWNIPPSDYVGNDGINLLA